MSLSAIITPIQLHKTDHPKLNPSRQPYTDHIFSDSERKEAYSPVSSIQTFLGIYKMTETLHPDLTAQSSSALVVIQKGSQVFEKYSVLPLKLWFPIWS